MTVDEVEYQYLLYRNSEKDGGIEADERRDGMQLPYPWKVQCRRISPEIGFWGK